MSLEIAEQHIHYDPRHQYESDEEANEKAIVWSSQSVEWALESMKNGRSLKRSPFFEGDPRRRRGDIVFRYTDEELIEIAKCMADITYFANTYVKSKTPEGIVDNIKLRDYQYEQMNDLMNFNRVIFGWSRQSGKTIGTAIYILWVLLFDVDKQAALLANKSKTAAEVLNKIKSIYVNLPFFLQAGIKGWNGGTILFDNDCKVSTGPATLDALNGMTANILYIDEFAFIGKGRNKLEYQKEFLANANPIVSSQKDGKIIISSTPNGKDLFYELFDNAMKGKNSYKASKVVWWQIPGKDEKWAEAERSEIGDSKFEQQYNLSFDTTQDTLLSAKVMKSLDVNKTKFCNTSFEDLLTKYEKYFSVSTKVQFDRNKDAFLFSVDLAEGLKQDYTVCQILKLEWCAESKKVKYRQVAMWRANDVSIEDFASVIAELFNKFNPDYSKLLVETNAEGSYFFKCLQSENNTANDIDLAQICKFKRSEDSDTLTKGLRTNAKIKQIAVKSFKTLMDSNMMIVDEEQTVKEITHFKQTDKGTYKAELGHDDCVTPLINAAYFIQLAEVEYSNWIEDFLEANGIAASESESRLEEKERELDDAELSEETLNSLSPEVLALLHSV